ncbi:indole-3-acetyl-L-aspartic acid hydrolase [Oceanobacillus iheyensis HTE831]|uniref:Indole-3-acetyl-L-aspartic acid hydrolase n=1 Tax=Oceanobacillus iheyensis (strain DSM 14371 / CIP 107618 / JCM 11309 / KCTC 3954 / HTE831) TaxID=221109 RepID=Q8ENA4_OCEIH|nr:amidohydrolase [Oceanobacillus iheyensis]BAC14539.1 indole-3-acetyl-L-aspartic acid hydrolase [Oceanobacillus iheyensis HTE831]
MSEFIHNLTQQLAQWRRMFHSYPELGFTEYLTTYRIGKMLEEWNYSLFVGKEALDSDARVGIPNTTLLTHFEQKAKEHGVEDSWLCKMTGGNTGLVATFDTGRPGKHIALRFDIDALPINESTHQSHIPASEAFNSINSRVMHACGHDGHITIGLGVAKYIYEHQSQLVGKFTFLFQPAEEGGRGALAMTKKGWLAGVDRFYAGHIGIKEMPVGTVAATVKGFLASTKLNVRYHGNASHAGINPEAGKNALLSASSAAIHLYGIPRHSAGTTRVNVGKLEAGIGRNIIPDEAFMEIEVRGETKELNNYMADHAKRIINAAAEMHDTKCEITTVGSTEKMSCSSSIINDIKNACEKSKYVKNVISETSVSGSEDASFMMNEVQKHGGQATYMLFGTKLDYPHHHPSFDFQEEVLPVAVDTFTRIIEQENTYVLNRGR